MIGAIFKVSRWLSRLEGCSYSLFHPMKMQIMFIAYSFCTTQGRIWVTLAQIVGGSASHRGSLALVKLGFLAQSPASYQLAAAGSQLKIPAETKNH